MKFQLLTKNFGKGVQPSLSTSSFHLILKVENGCAPRTVASNYHRLILKAKAFSSKVEPGLQFSLYSHYSSIEMHKPD